MRHQPETDSDDEDAPRRVGPEQVAGAIAGRGRLLPRYMQDANDDDELRAHRRRLSGAAARTFVLHHHGNVVGNMAHVYNNNQRRWITRTNWMVTVYGPEWEPPDALPAGVRFMAGQVERGNEPGAANPNNGLHWQLYVQFEARTDAWEGMMMLGMTTRRTYWEQQRSGSNRNCFYYVTKPDTCVDVNKRFVLGQMEKDPAPVQRAQMMQDIRDGASEHDIEQAYPGLYLSLYSTVRQLLDRRDHDDAPEKRDVKVYGFFGLPNTGKTFNCRKLFPGEDIYVMPPGTNGFWNNYKGEGVVIINDRMPNKPGAKETTEQVQLFLNNCDGLKTSVNIKGSSKSARFHTLVYTSNYFPLEWWPDVHDDTKHAIMRRFHRIYLMHHWNAPPLPFTHDPNNVTITDELKSFSRFGMTVLLKERRRKFYQEHPELANVKAPIAEAPELFEELGEAVTL